MGGYDAVDSDGSGHQASPLPDTEDDTNHFGFVGAGAIGNYIWIDENSDGYQDAGEPGIPNVEVRLYNGTGALVGTTYTDSAGGYVFDGLIPGDYYVDVLDGTGGQANTLPAGLTQTTPSTLTGGDGGNQDHGTTSIPGGGGLTGYAVTLGGGQPLENPSADFGYNWATDTDINCGTNTGAIGDRVWVDADGDGAQDPNEIGIEGVTVELVTAGPDGLFDTGDDVVAQSTATDANGNYIFDGLAAGAYVVRVDSGVPGGYTQTGDPDHFGTTGAPNDGQTTAPVVLGPGDVFLNADFGYQPGGGATGSIGDFVWFDADADGAQDAGEPGIAGVTVSLIEDSNGNGVWDAGEPIIGTDTTDGSGAYLFEGLPITGGAGSDDYLVWVSDTDNVLAELSNTNDSRDGSEPNPSTGVASGLGISAVTDLSATAVTDADFGYTVAGHTSGAGLIGDTIFFDTDRDGSQGAGEVGVEGVVVELYNGAGTTLLATTTTDENGNYHFGGLPVSAAGTDYEVRVAASNFADGGVLEGTTNTADPDGGFGSLSDVSLTTAVPTNLDQDFGYAAPNVAGDFGSIGNLVWLDENADGDVDAGEAGIAGVTVDLYRDLNGNGLIDPGEPRIGMTTTDGSGAYLFENLPTEGDGDGDAQAEYIVDVTDTAGVLAGHRHSLGTAGADDNSQTDPYAVEIGDGTGGQPAADNLTADFGYYVEPAAVGNFVWQDDDGDGEQDAGEAGIANALVTLTITWPDTSTTVLNTRTDGAGRYSFDNLLLDEDYNGDGAGEPSFEITFTAPTGLTHTIPNASGVGDTVDSDWDGSTGIAAAPEQGNTDTALTNTIDTIASYDAGFAVRDLRIDTACSDYTGTSPFTIATNTVTHEAGSVLDATGLTMVHTLDSASAPSEDPFFDTYMLTYQTPRSWNFPLEVDHLVAGAGTASLRAGAWGLTEWPGTDPDHHTVVGLNGEAVTDRSFDGQSAVEIETTLPEGLLVEGANALEITMPGDTGFAYDMVVLDRYAVSYPRAFVARGGRLSFEAAGEAFEVSGLLSPNVIIYRTDDRGGTRQLVSMRIRQEGDTWTTTFLGQSRSARYHVTTAEALGEPAMEAVRPHTDITSGAADYLVLAHPSFVARIAPLVAHHEVRGLSVKVVDTRDIYEQYGDGEYGAEAIRAYLSAAQQTLGYEYVLLVGGDTYDYFGHLGNSMSFVPTLYHRTHPQMPHAPVDPLYVDFDGDYVQDAAIGRLPVRTTTELDAVVANTLAYAAKDYAGSAVFAADGGYARDSEDLVAGLPGGWGVTPAYLEESGVDAARSVLIDRIAEGVALTNFVGHSGPTAWTFSGLFDVGDVQSLANAGKPTAVVQWGCWNTYHVAASTNTLGHALMLSGDRGAALVLGATTLTQDESEMKLGRLVLPRLTAPGQTAGQAVLEAKRELAQTDPALLDVLLGWTLLGDPAAVVQE